ncbi:outer membrane beta-barrel domain-containing protein [Bdellovibrio sp. HCB2-146]|uniref:outer membrane beta-barrel domain-containing protein n=1 Tax=Bdellovibrio sp. HCB2-146 TaxID=3394362 RepID=UPI0039BD64A3
MKNLALIFALLVTPSAFADVEQELDSFGGNQALYEKAKALNPEIENNVVQNRFVERSRRFEFAPEFSGVANGGDTYNRTTSAGMNVHYHINPSWSVGAKYNYSFNALTPEGKEMVERANQAADANPKDPNYLYPQVVYQKSEVLGFVNWYPVVGKLSFGKRGVAHFDTYLTAGYGTIELSNGSSPLATLGVGMGFWLGRHMTTRVEYRGEQYTAQYYDKSQNMLTGVASVQMGWML